MVAPDLPGRGQDRTPLSSISLDVCARCVCEAIDAQSEPAILVGHSMAGAVISQAGEYRSEKVRALVYICAYLLRDGETLAAIAQRDASSEARQNVTMLFGGSAMFVRHEAIEHAFYGDCAREDAVLAESRLVPEATSVWFDAVHLTPQRFGRIPRFYIECLRDRAISPSLQRQMCDATPCTRVYTLHTDHSPFLSDAPRLADLLMLVSEAAGGVDSLRIPQTPSM